MADDYAPEADTTDIDCGNPANKYETAWCASSVPTGEKMQVTKETLNRIEQRGQECAAIAQRGRTLLRQGGIRYFPANAVPVSGDKSFGGVGSPEMGALLADVYITYYGLGDRSQKLQDKDGSTIVMNFDLALSHEIEHQMGRYHTKLSNGEDSKWLTPNAKECSGVN